MLDFEEWAEINEDEVWISFHESGACYEGGTLEDWEEHLYDIYANNYQEDNDGT